LKAENIDRHSVILGFGGGVVTDIAGFVAATYLRGVPLILIPTSLLAMADAAVGGKNGINYAGIKNMIGTVRQPDATQIDSNFLETLPDEHYKNGLAEMLKIAFIMDEELIKELEDSVNDILNRKTVVLNKLLHRACQLKIRLVENDEQDKNIRHILNFGHSLGHAIEMEDRTLHGLAVSKGMIAAMRLSMKYSGLKESEYLRCRELMQAFDLPVEFEMKDAYWKYLVHDKKRKEGKLSFIFLESAGNAVIRKIDFQDVKKLLYAT
ncbi:MAG: 3-dehydroquinate synthase, partial [Bacteroidota bacterium]